MAAAVGMAGLALGQSNAPVRDFGGGFTKFYQLGMPDVTGATYGKVEFTHYGYAGDFGLSSGRNIDQLGLSGNGWKLKSLGEGSNRYVLGAVQLLDAMDMKAFEAWQKKQRDAMAKAGAASPQAMPAWDQPAMPAVKWKPGDVAKDVVKVLKALESARDEDSSVAWIAYDIKSGGELLLMAAQLYRAGMKDEANRIADRLFALNKNPRQLLESAVGIIATDQYNQSYGEFRRTRDWAKWYGSLTNLSARFAGSWTMLPGVNQLSGMVKARAGQAAPPPLSGEGLAAEDQELARRLAVEAPVTVGNSFYGHECWIFPQPHHRQMARLAATNDAIFAVVNRGLTAVPMLVAMLKDGTLTLRDRQQGGVYVDPFMSMGMGGEQSGDAMFNSLQRPMTRGEIARSMLQPILLMDERQRGGLQRMAADDFAVECEAWLKEHKGKTVEQLAKVYVEKGDHNQRQYAMNCLMRGKNAEANRAEVEKMLLALVKDSTDTPYIVQEYVRQRKDKASNFVEQVAAIMSVTNAPAQPPAGMAGRHVRRPPRGAERDVFVKQLRDLVSARSVRDLLNDYVSGSQSSATVRMKLAEQLGREPADESLAALLDAAGKVGDPAKACMLLSMVHALKYSQPGGVDETDDESMEPGAVAPVANKFDPAKHAEPWNKLLSDKRGTNRTVGEAAAWAIETLYSDDQRAMVPGAFPGGGDVAVLAMLGDRGRGLLAERARARLAGKPVPELPSADKVDDAQRKRITAGLLDAADPSAALAKLTADEDLAVREIGRTNKALSAKLRPLADKIVDVQVPPDMQAASGLAAKIKGRLFDKETVRTVVDSCLQMAKEGNSFNVVVSRRPGACGTSVAFSKPAAPDQNPEVAVYYAMTGMAVAGTNRQVVAGVRAFVAAGKRSASAWWPAREPAGAAPGASAAGTVEARLLDEAEAEIRAIAARQRKNEQDNFWEELAAVMDKAGAFTPISVMLSVEAAEGAPPAAAK
jgi:hypothetical protein